MNIREKEELDSDVLVMQNESTEQYKNYYLFFKRALDIIFSLIGLVLLSPVFLILILVIRKSSKGPAIFEHKRVGKNEKIIKIYKFRTMVADADNFEKYFTPEQMKEYKKNYKLENDPRITRIGKLLRKTSLDELPQIINILKGDLSIIGPRPVVEEELEKYGEQKSKFLSVTPGLTGYWAANGRSDTTYEERIQMELYYVDNISLKMDIKIFFKTFISVLKKEGAV